MNKFKLIAAALLASTMGITLASCGPNGEVSSIAIKEGSSKTLNLNDTITLHVNISINGEATKDVDWVSSDETVAKITPDGASCTVKGLKEGSAKITATSRFDKSKSASITINVADLGFDPSFIDEGYEFSKTFPGDKAKAFLGSQDVELITPSSSGGYYYLTQKSSEESAGYFEVVVKGVVDEEFWSEYAEKASWKTYYSSRTGYSIIDPKNVYDCVVYTEHEEDYEDYDDEDYLLFSETRAESASEDITYFTFYKASEVWGSSTKTTDNAWDVKMFKECLEAQNDDYYDYYEEYLFTEEEIDEYVELISTMVPFIALGEEYDLYYDYYDDGFEYYDDGFEISDYCLNDSFLSGYGSVLTGAGYAKKTYTYEGQSYDYYAKAKDETNEYVIEFMWGEYGNTIYFSESPIEFDSYPASAVNKFTSQTLGSKFEIPSLTFAQGETCVFNEGTDEESGVAYAQVMFYGINSTQLFAHGSEIKNGGFTLVKEEGNFSEDYYELKAYEKGKIHVELVHYEEVFYGYSLGEYFCMEITGCEGYEEPGVYYSGKGVRVSPEGEIDVSKLVVVYDLPEAVLSYTSSDPSKATVDASTGVVHGVAEGTAEITVSDGNGHSCVVPVTVSVVQEKNMKIVATNIGDPNSGYAKCDGNHTVNNFVMTTSNVMNMSGSLQFKKSGGTLFNYTAYEDGLISIILPTNSLEVSFGSTASNLTKVTGVSEGGGYKFTAPEGSQYFSITNNGSTVATISEISINYSEK